MPIVGAALSSDIESALAPWDGTKLSTFSQSIGNGLALATSGTLGFITQDTGLIPGVGNGTGKGIVGMDPSSMAQIIFDTGQGFWSSQQRDGPGVEWQGFCDRLSQAIVDHLQQNADLMSVHGPVFAGIGQVQQYFGLVPQAVAQSIVGQAPGGWAQARFPELALAVATGYVQEITGHSPGSTVTIVGSFTGPVPPGPVPGSGSGSGIVL